MSEGATVIECSFCNKSQKEVFKLIAGPDCYICDECVGLSSDIIAEDRAAGFPTIADAPPVALALRRAVVGQEAAVAAVLGALRQHLLPRAEGARQLPTPNLLIAGPAGCGKTTFARALTEASPIPAFHANLDRITATGYIGEDIEGMLLELRRRSPSSPAHAERGLIAIDNLDHLTAKRAPPGTVRDVTGVEVQRALLRILEGQECTVYEGARHPQQPYQPFATRGLMRVLFATVSGVETVGDVRDALREGGVSAGLLSRIHVVVPMRALTREDLHAILTRPEVGMLTGATELLRNAGIELSVGTMAVERIVDRALAASDGGWSLERQVAGLVHDLATNDKSGRVLVMPEDIERIGA